MASVSGIPEFCLQMLGKPDLLDSLPRACERKRRKVRALN